jgi:hypothetical protein
MVLVELVLESSMDLFNERICITDRLTTLTLEASGDTYVSRMFFSTLERFIVRIKETRGSHNSSPFLTV